MDAGLYEFIIFNNFLKFFISKPSIVFLHQDNDAKHCSNLCFDAIINLGIKWVGVKSKNKLKFKIN
jgi:hypothetical protein